MLIIGISGKIRSGKDAAAAHMVQRYGFTVIRFADALREEVLARLRLTLLAIHDQQDVHGCDSGDIDACLHEMVYVRKPPIVRELLQEYGTEVRRADDTQYWTRRWAERIAGLDRVVVPDVRFLNEAVAIRAAGGLLWRVTRPGTTAGIHVSERFVDEWKDWDSTINNDSTLRALHEAVDSGVKDALFALALEGGTAA